MGITVTESPFVYGKTRPLYEKADNPNARLIRAVALRSGRLRPIGFPDWDEDGFLKTANTCCFAVRDEQTHIQGRLRCPKTALSLRRLRKLSAFADWWGGYVPLIRPDLTVSPPSPRGEGFSDTSLTLSMTFCCHYERSLLSFWTNILVILNEVKNLFDYNVQNEASNLADTSLTLSMT